jgi:hypothetical protein
VTARRLLPWAVASAVLCDARPAAAQARVRAATVSLLEGTAQMRRGPGVPRDLREGSSVQQGDAVETGDDSRLELKLPEGSALRLGPRARLLLAAAHFGGGPARRQLSVKLFFGKVWAKVTSAVGADQTFQIETENAVAGVRGTAFRVDAHEDRSVLVRVYSGTVAVRRNAPGYARPEDGGRREVPGPEEVAREAWEKLVGRQMQILISADGTPGVPAPFTEADEKDDDWSAWNRKRDEQAK